MTLEEIRKDLETTTEMANKNLEELPTSTQGAWGTAISEAKNRVKGLREQYKRSLLDNAAAIFVSGEPAKATQFAKLVHDETEGLVVDANALYERLAQGVEQTLSDARSWGVAQTHKLHLLLQEVLSEIGLTEMPMPSRDESPVVATYQDTLDHVRKVITDAVGNSLNKLYLEEQAVKDALEIRYTGNMVPVVVLNARPEEVLSIGQSFAKGTTMVNLTAEDQIDNDFMVKTFKDTQKKLRKKQ